MRHVTIDAFLTPQELRLAQEIHRSCKARKLVSAAPEIRDRIIQPAIDRINASLGQENDPMYLAYCVEYVLDRAGNS